MHLCISRLMSCYTGTCMNSEVMLLKFAHLLSKSNKITWKWPDFHKNRIALLNVHLSPDLKHAHILLLVVTWIISSSWGSMLDTMIFCFSPYKSIILTLSYRTWLNDMSLKERLRPFSTTVIFSKTTGFWSFQSALGFSWWVKMCLLNLEHSFSQSELQIPKLHSCGRLTPLWGVWSFLSMEGKKN